jgi:hypothetical protein
MAALSAFLRLAAALTVGLALLEQDLALGVVLAVNVVVVVWTTSDVGSKQKWQEFKGGHDRCYKVR